MATTLQRPIAENRTKPAIIDCDIHNELDSERDLYPYLPPRWLEYVQTYGMRGPSGAIYPASSTAATTRTRLPGATPGRSAASWRSNSSTSGTSSTASSTR